MPRWAARADANQQEIIDGLRDYGCSVVSLHRVGGGVGDLLVGIRRVNLLMEVKNPDTRGELNKKQTKFFDEWRGQKAVVWDLFDAIKVIEDETEVYK